MTQQPSLELVRHELRIAQAAREILVDDRGADPALVHSRGYWKRGRADHQEPHAN